MKHSSKYPDYSDLELLSIISSRKAGDEHAFYELYNRYHIKVFNYFYRRLKSRDDADDMHQETFENLIKSVRNGRCIENVQSYIFSIARNVLINRQVSKYVSKTGKIDESQDSELFEDNEYNSRNCQTAGSDVTSYEMQELIDLIKWAVSALDEKYRDPFIDKVYNYLSIKEIADKYNLSYDGAKKRVDRAQTFIKKLLKPYIDDINR